MIRFAMLLLVILMFVLAVQVKRNDDKLCAILEHSIYAHMAVEKLDKSYFDRFEALCD